MKTNIKPENRRLLDAFYYIDEEVLSDVLADVRVPDTAPEMSKSRAFMRSLRYTALIAACTRAFSQTAFLSATRILRSTCG